MPTYTSTTFDNVLVSSDGGQEVVELAITGAEIYELYRSGKLEIGNVRPDHDIKVSKRGDESYAKTPKRLDQWAEELNHNRAIVGNLSWNIDPDDCKWDLDRDRNTLTVRSGTITTPDSATRHRALVKAMESTPRTFDPETLFSVRCWFVPDESDDPAVLTWPEVFNSYNQRGKPVDSTVSKWTYQGDAVERLTHKFVLGSDHLGLDNIETKGNRVSVNSPKLAAYNTFVIAVTDTWTTDLDTTEDEDREAAWLIEFWDRLAKVRPELSNLGLSRRRQARNTSLAGAAVMIPAYLAIADRIRVEGHDLSLLDELDDTVTLQTPGLRHATGVEIDWLDFDNPEWQDRGVVFSSITKAGEKRLKVRNSMASRRATQGALLAKVGLGDMVSHA